MDRDRFEALIAAYGAEPRRWPDTERVAASAYAQTDAAQALLAEARALDAMLDAVGPAPAASDTLVARVLVGARKIGRARVFNARALAALAASALLGVSIGLGAGARLAQTPADEVLLSAVFESGGFGETNWIGEE